MLENGQRQTTSARRQSRVQVSGQPSERLAVQAPIIDTSGGIGGANFAAFAQLAARGANAAVPIIQQKTAQKEREDTEQAATDYLADNLDEKLIEESAAYSRTISRLEAQSTITENRAAITDEIINGVIEGRYSVSEGLNAFDQRMASLFQDEEGNFTFSDDNSDIILSEIQSTKQRLAPALFEAIQTTRNTQIVASAGDNVTVSMEAGAEIDFTENLKQLPSKETRKAAINDYVARVIARSQATGETAYIDGLLDAKLPDGKTGALNGEQRLRLENAKLTAENILEQQEREQRELMKNRLGSEVFSAIQNDQDPTELINSLNAMGHFETAFSMQRLYDSQQAALQEAASQGDERVLSGFQVALATTRFENRDQAVAALLQYDQTGQLGRGAIRLSNMKNLLGLIDSQYDQVESAERSAEVNLQSERRNRHRSNVTNAFRGQKDSFGFLLDPQAAKRQSEAVALYDNLVLEQGMDSFEAYQKVLTEYADDQADDVEAANVSGAMASISRVEASGAPSQNDIDIILRKYPTKQDFARFLVTEAGRELSEAQQLNILRHVYPRD